MPDDRQVTVDDESDELETLRRLQHASHVEALRVIVGMYSVELHGYATYLCANPDDAATACSKATSRLVRRVRQGSLPSEPPIEYLKRMVRMQLWLISQPPVEPVLLATQLHEAFDDEISVMRSRRRETLARRTRQAHRRYGRWGRQSRNQPPDGR